MDDESGISPPPSRVESHVHSLSTSSPMLEDFNKLRHHAWSCLESPPPPPAWPEDASPARTRRSSGAVVCHQPAPSTASAQLGDFFRIFALLQTRTTAIESPHQSSKAAPVEAQRTQSLTFAFRQATRKPASSPAACLPSSVRLPSAYGPCNHHSGLDVPYSTADSDPQLRSDSGYAVESSISTPPLSSLASTHRYAPPSASPARRKSRHAQMRRSDVGHVLSYRFSKHGPLIPVVDKLRSRRERFESLSLGLVPLRDLDRLGAMRYPDITSHGIHVFLDMSNINISFHETLRAWYSIHERARFAPLPTLDLRLLNEVLVRGRRAVALNAGCSVLPGRSEPRYVQELRHLGYHVDLRERKQVAKAAKPQRARSAAGASSSSDEMSHAAGSVRYVEDLVDETLQTRIAESVMEYFQKQGTLVLATGDGRPAKYSDGFFAYAERALKMGWNVEVVSWKKSLSCSWKSSECISRWGDRFRIIELDDFVEDLLAYCV